MNQMATVFVQGATAATCVIVGNTIGAGKLDELPRQKRFFQTFVLIMGTVAGLVIFFTGDFVISLYDVSAVTRQYASQMILITAVIQPFCAFQITNMMGILRGGCLLYTSGALPHTGEGLSTGHGGLRRPDR